MKMFSVIMLLVSIVLARYYLEMTDRSEKLLTSVKDKQAQILVCDHKILYTFNVQKTQDGSEYIKSGDFLYSPTDCKIIE